MVPAQNSWATFLQRTVHSLTPVSSGTPRHSNGTVVIVVVRRITKRFRTPELRSSNFPAFPRVKSAIHPQTKPNDLITSRDRRGMFRDHVQPGQSNFRQQYHSKRRSTFILNDREQQQKPLTT